MLKSLTDLHNIGNMAGYNYDSWKSNNAVDAESRGLYPASVVAKKSGTSTTWIRNNFSPVEKHHTSNRYNMTEYYSLEEVLGRKSEYKKEDETDKPWRKKANVNWLEWGKKGEPPVKRSLNNVWLRFSGKSTYTFDDNGVETVKRESTKGFTYELILRFQPAKSNKPKISKREESARKKAQIARLKEYKEQVKMEQRAIMKSGKIVPESVRSRKAWGERPADFSIDEKKAWVSISPNGNITGVYRMDGTGEPEKQGRDFEEYRSLVKTFLGKKGSVVSGVLHIVNGDKVYFVPNKK